MSNDQFKEVLDELKNKFDISWSTNPKDTATWDDFERKRTLGRGAFGRVMLVKHKKTDSYYALKVLSKQEIIKSRQVDNAVNEKKMLMSIQHHYFINLAYSFKDNSYLYLVLEFIIGGEMFNLLRNMKRFPEGMVRFYGAQVVLGFEYLQYLQIAYRDLKPENVLINADGYIKIADLGFAKQIVNKRTWTLCGTPDYMAPEIITNKGYHWAVDWWAFGVLLYEMTAGFPPFMHQDQMKTFEHILTGKVKFTSGFSSELKDLVRSLIQVDLSKRFGNLKNGIADIKDHRFFSGTDWMGLYKKSIKPPYKPKAKGPDDTSAFDKWEEEILKVADKDKWEREFKDF